MVICEHAQRASKHSPDLSDLARRRLWRSPYQAMKNVLCEYRCGVLFLRGRLPSYYFKQIAQETVANIEGIVQVINAIEVNEESG
jgi:hypothetical protein